MNKKLELKQFVKNAQSNRCDDLGSDVDNSIQVLPANFMDETPYNDAQKFNIPDGKDSQKIKVSENPLGDLSAEWVDEGAIIPKAKTKFAAKTLIPGKLAILIDGTGELIDDAEYIPTVLRTKAAEAIKYAINKSMVYGSGELGNSSVKGIVADSKQITFFSDEADLKYAIPEMYSKVIHNDKNIFYFGKKAWDKALEEGIVLFEGKEAYIYGQTAKCVNWLNKNDVIYGDFSLYSISQKPLQQEVSEHFRFDKFANSYRTTLRIAGEVPYYKPFESEDTEYKSETFTDNELEVATEAELTLLNEKFRQADGWPSDGLLNNTTRTFSGWSVTNVQCANNTVFLSTAPNQNNGAFSDVISPLIEGGIHKIRLNAKRQGAQSNNFKPYVVQYSYDKSEWITFDKVTLADFPAIDTFYNLEFDLSVERPVYIRFTREASSDFAGWFVMNEFTAFDALGVNLYSVKINAIGEDDTISFTYKGDGNFWADNCLFTGSEYLGTISLDEDYAISKQVIDANNTGTLLAPLSYVKITKLIDGEVEVLFEGTESVVEELTDKYDVDINFTTGAYSVTELSSSSSESSAEVFNINIEYVYTLSVDWSDYDITANWIGDSKNIEYGFAALASMEIGKIEEESSSESSLS
jgi:hypothetical protein